MKKYKYNKLLPLNVRIPFRWRNNISYVWRNVILLIVVLIRYNNINTLC